MSYPRFLVEEVVPPVAIILIALAIILFFISSFNKMERKEVARKQAEMENTIDIKFVDGTEMHGLKRAQMDRPDILKTEDGQIIKIQNWNNVIWTKETPPRTNSIPVEAK